MSAWARPAALTLGAGLLALAALIAGGRAAEAAAPVGDPAPVQTVLVVDPPGEAPIGEAPMVVAYLTTTTGEAVADAAVELYVDGQLAGRSRTDAAGRAVIRGPRQLPIGDYEAMVIFYGDSATGLRPSEAETTFTVVPITIEIEAVPALPGVRFAVVPLARLLSPWQDATPEIHVTDQTGIARIPLAEPGLYQVEVLPWEGIDPNARAEFARWLDEVFLPRRQFETRPGLRLQVGFQVSFLVSQTFVDLDGNPIDPARVSRLQLKSSVGERITIEEWEPRWLAGVRVSRQSSGLMAVPILYRVESVTLDGVADVVNRGQQAFMPETQRLWTIHLLTYSARVTSVDAFFGFPVGTEVLFIYPNGTTLTVPLDAEGTATVAALPRGQYQVSILGGGYSPPRPVALTRDQDMSLQVISHLDMALAFGLVAVIALGLLIIGRPGFVLVPLRLLHPKRLKRVPKVALERIWP